MSDGGGESGKENEQIVNRKSGGGDFGQVIAKIAVGQICESVGFQGFQQSALKVLSDIAIRYLCGLGKTAHFYSNLAGRTECNIFDIIQGLEDLESHGFSGASDVNHCLAGSGAIREIIRYMCLAEEIPFARPIPHFPVIRNRKPTQSFLQIRETPAAKHVPAWLPAFPDPRTDIHTPLWNERATDSGTNKIEEKRQQRKVEWSLLSLQQRLACNGLAAPASVDTGDVGKAKGATESNPFLAPPLQFGEKDVVHVSIPAKLSNETAVEKRVSVLDTFTPTIEEPKSGFCDLGDGNRKCLQNKDADRTTLGYAMDDEKDDKKRRAEQILKESKENPRELAQL
ncbi:hypothetical protein HHK36_015476 [Tetracentron sinense]|uniref:Transcription initiation factor TFIID subunit 8 n=1 Tax=Tetracentron sinense TaxID=13715 RepID=A0A834ZBH9_TETSI|nr:hypothetical protein HHK36_015476 [Tetracentron sinense]